MNSLRRFVTTFFDWLRNLWSRERPRELAADEQLARFLLQSNQFSATKGLVKRRAFTPTTKGQTSVYRIQGLQPEGIYRLGRRHVAPEPTKTIYGWGTVLVRIVEAQGLSVVPDNRPPRHANIEGWPNDKDEQMLLAHELAAAASLALWS